MEVAEAPGAGSACEGQRWGSFAWRAWLFWLLRLQHGGWEPHPALAQQLGRASQPECRCPAATSGQIWAVSFEEQALTLAHMTMSACLSLELALPGRLIIRWCRAVPWARMGLSAGATAPTFRFKTQSWPSKKGVRPRSMAGVQALFSPILSHDAQPPGWAYTAMCGTS